MQGRMDLTNDGNNKRTNERKKTRGRREGSREGWSEVLRRVCIKHEGKKKLRAEGEEGRREESKGEGL